jgi:membrane-anchored protein YejM (alkaline phosphatase superfamily)
VPLLIGAPFLKPGSIDHLTGHVDLAPTLLNWLGCLTAPDKYSHGRDLLSPEGRAFVVSSGWDDFALITPRRTIVLSMESYNVGRTEIRDANYREIEDTRAALKEESHNLVQFSREYRRFFQ